MRQPPDPRFAAEVVHRNGTAEIVVRGDVDLSTASELRRVLEAAVDDGARIDLDLRETTFLDSTGLAVLVGASRRMGQLQETIVIRNPRPLVRRVLEISGVDVLVDIRDGDSSEVADEPQERPDGGEG